MVNVIFCTYYNSKDFLLDIFSKLVNIIRRFCETSAYVTDKNEISGEKRRRKKEILLKKDVLQNNLCQNHVYVIRKY